MVQQGDKRYYENDKTSSPSWGFPIKRSAFFIFYFYFFPFKNLVEGRDRKR